MPDLSGKTFIITGGNGGIGLGMAEGIAAAGGEFAIWGRKEEKNGEALEKLEAYGTAKTGLNGLVRALAVALARYGIRVNSLLPGSAKTELKVDLSLNPPPLRLGKKTECERSNSIPFVDHPSTVVGKGILNESGH